VEEAHDALAAIRVSAEPFCPSTSKCARKRRTLPIAVALRFSRHARPDSLPGAIWGKVCSTRLEWEPVVIFRQLFDATSGTYTYLLASRRGGEALIIDPVLEKVDRYLQLIRELDLKLVKAIDTHLHADHITGLGALRDRTRCITVMGEQSSVDVVSMRIADGDRLGIEGISLDVAYTPGHTDDSYSFIMPDRVFTGDTLLIRGTGRTDFQNGDPRAQYDSIFHRLLRLPDETMVFPAHDYKGDTVSTIGEEKRYNPRLQVRSVDEYAALMNSLNLSNPKMMDVAVPANMRQGLAQQEIARRGWAVTAEQARELVGSRDIVLIDLRERTEREKHGVIAGSLHAPYPDLQANIQAGGMLHELASATSKRLVFYCAFGERSAMAVQAAQDAGLATACHIHGGIDAWKKADGPVTH
jgi:sulfur dioxygenase